MIVKKQNLFWDCIHTKSCLNKNRIYLHKKRFFQNKSWQRKQKKRKAFLPTNRKGAIFFVYFAVFCYPRPSNGFVLEQKRKIALFYLKPAERENCVIRRWLEKKLLCSTVCCRATGTYGDSGDLYLFNFGRYTNPFPIGVHSVLEQI